MVKNIKIKWIKLLFSLYLDASTSNLSRSEIKNAFTQYQKDNDLPSGKFYVTTLAHLAFN